MEAFWVRAMSRFSPLKFKFFPVILVVLATESYAYQLPGEPPKKDDRLSFNVLHLPIQDNPVESSVAREGEDAATMKYGFGEEEGFSFSSSYSSRMENPFDRFGKLEADGFWDLSLSTPLAGALPAVDIDYSVGGFDGDSGDQFGDADHRMLSVEFNGELGIFEHGLGYESVGAEYYTMEDDFEDEGEGENSETIESWIGKSFGNMSISQFIQLSESDNGFSEESLQGTKARYTWSSWPYIGTSFSHATGTRKNGVDDSGDDGFEVGISSVSGALSMAHNIWNADFYVSRKTVDESADHSYGEPDLTSYYLSGSIYPNKTLTLTHSLSVAEENYREYEAETRSTSIALSLKYKPTKKNIVFTAYASNDTEKNLDWGTDVNYFYSKAGIEWDLSDRSVARNILSLTVGYDRYEDHIYSSSNMDDLSVMISFKSYSLGSILRSHDRSKYDNSSVHNALNGPANYGLSPIFP
jgi:hypothetical protein